MDIFYGSKELNTVETVLVSRLNPSKFFDASCDQFTVFFAFFRYLLMSIFIFILPPDSIFSKNSHALNMVPLISACSILRMFLRKPMQKLRVGHGSKVNTCLNNYGLVWRRLQRIESASGYSGDSRYLGTQVPTGISEKFRCYEFWLISIPIAKEQKAYRSGS